MTTQIRKTIDSKNEASKDVKHEADENIKHRTVFDEILHSNLPPEELLVSRLQDEASVLVSAGLETTKMTLTIACFHILDNPDVYRQLCQELKKVFPDPIMQPALPELEKLPYLTAVIQECKTSVFHRHHYRVIRQENMLFKFERSFNILLYTDLEIMTKRL